MKNVRLVPNGDALLKDYVEMNFSDKLETVLFAEEVPIAQIWQTQERVYDDSEAGALILCEEVAHYIPHFPLHKVNYGHPKFEGESVFSKTVEEHLKERVGNHKLSDINGEPTDEKSLQKVQAHISALEQAGRVQPSDSRMAKKWEKKKLIEPDAKTILNQEVTNAKYFDTSLGFKEWAEVTISIFSLVLIFDVGISNAWRIAAMPVP